MLWLGSRPLLRVSVLAFRGVGGGRHGQEISRRIFAVLKARLGVHRACGVRLKVLLRRSARD